MIDGRPRELAQRVDEWFLRRQTLQAARLQLPRRDQLSARAFDQVRLLREIARQFGESADAPSSGGRNAALLSVYRELVYWALVAGAPGEGGISPDLTGLWSGTTGDKLLRAAGNERNLDAVQAVLVTRSPLSALDATEEDVARVRAFANALYEDLAAPRRRVASVVAQRWVRVLGVAAGLVTLVLVIRGFVIGPDLTGRGTMRVSSPLPGCAADPGCADLLFHTNQENNPWVEFDFGAPAAIHVIDVSNRRDCCQDRAVPLVAEISTDGTHWKEVARQDKEFSRWKAKLPRTVARYVRLRVPRATFFGLADVAIR